MDIPAAFAAFRTRSEVTPPLLLEGDAADVLRLLPPDSIDFAMTSPPYWGKREYGNGGLGREGHWREFVTGLCAVCREIKRVLKPSGSFWLNLGDSYADKGLAGIPWRVALELIDDQGWVLRNQVVWNKIKGGMDNTRDRLANVHEPLFHFVRQPRGYYYDAAAIRSRPRAAKVIDGRVVSATGVSGVRYRRQIELTTALDTGEKQAACAALDEMLARVAAGELADFRMVIRGCQRATHSDRASVSGRARELAEAGFYFLKYHPDGAKPGDVWDILPEDTQGREVHFAPYPESLCRIPLLATCPPGGIALDPFCGTGSTLAAARDLGRKAVGIDIAPEYLALARRRLNNPAPEDGNT